MNLRTLLALIILPAALTAQVPAKDSVYEVAPLVVTAERQPLPPAAVSGSVTVLQGDALRLRGVRSVADALREVPGAAVVPTGSWGGQTSLFLRGGESDYVKVLIDGVAMNQPGGAFDFGALTLDNVDRIEVVRGPASVLYGSDAVTGVIQIFTRNGTGPLGIDAALAAGRFNTSRANVTLGAGSDRLSWSAGVAQDATNGIYQVNSDWRNTVGDGRATYRLSDATRLRGSLRYGDDTFHYPTLSDGTPGDSNTASHRKSAALSLGLDHALEPSVTFGVTANLSREDIARSNDRDSPADTNGFGFASRDEAIVLRRAVEARLTVTPSEKWSMTYGSEYSLDQEERLPGYAVSNFGFGIDSSTSARSFHNRRNIGSYVQAVLQPSAAWSLSGGVRVDNNEAFGQFFTTRAGIVRRFGDATRLRASIGTGFKTPTLEEAYGNSAFSVGDPGLKPERSHSWEIGAERSLGTLGLTVGAVWFDQKFSEMIQYGFVSPGAPTYYNVAGATARGLDLTVNARPSRALAVDGGVTRLYTEVTDPGFSTGSGDVFVKGKELIRRPAWSGHLGGIYAVQGRARLGGTLTYVGKRTDVDFGPFPSVRKELPAYGLLDLNADVDIVGPRDARTGPDFAVTLRVENVLDKEYQTVVGFPGRGRTLLAGVRMHR